MDPMNPIDPANPMAGSGLPTQPVKERKTAAVWLVVLILVAAAVAVTWYYFNYMYSVPSAAFPHRPSVSRDAATDQLLWQGSSDELEAIEKDLGATDFGDLDQGVSDISGQL